MFFPDTLPQLDGHFHLLEADFLDLKPDIPTTLRAILSSESVEYPSSMKGQLVKSYSHIVTLFFIDASPNILSTLSQIHTLLKPGGIWINLGPLLWPSGGTASMELSLEEVLHAVKLTGFKLKVLNPEPSINGTDSRTRQVDCEYTADREAMMRWVYEARFWIAEKL